MRVRFTSISNELILNSSESYQKEKSSSGLMKTIIVYGYTLKEMDTPLSSDATFV